jgi:hypothetical protein
MKPLQIGLLVLVGALGGALIMKFTQRPKPPAVAAEIASPAPAPAPVPAAVSVSPAPVPDAPPSAPAAAPAPPPEPSGPKASLKPNTAPAVKMTHHSRPMLRTPPTVATVAQNMPPAQPEPPAAQSSPLPVQEPTAPAITAEPAPAPVPTPAPPAESVEPPAPQPAPSVTLQTGMTLPVRLGESLSSEHNQAGDTFSGALDAPLSAGGFVIAEKGAHVEGRVVEAQKSGVKGKATLALELTRLNTSDGQHVDIKTETLRKQSENMATGDQVGVVAAAAGIGAIIGALAGGGKGAAIGAGAGGAAGGGGVVATRNKAISLPTESKISFRLSAPVTVTERLNQ